MELCPFEWIWGRIRSNCLCGAFGWARTSPWRLQLAWVAAVDVLPRSLPFEWMESTCNSTRYANPWVGPYRSAWTKAAVKHWLWGKITSLFVCLFAPQDDLSRACQLLCPLDQSRWCQAAVYDCVFACLLLRMCGSFLGCIMVPVPITEAAMASASAGGYARLKFAQKNGPFSLAKSRDRLSLGWTASLLLNLSRGLAHSFDLWRLSLHTECLDAPKPAHWLVGCGFFDMSHPAWGGIGLPERHHSTSGIP